MNRDFLKELELESETIESIMKEHGKAVNDYKQKAEQADSLQSQLDDLNGQIKDRDKQLEDLQSKASDNKTLTAEIDSLKQQNETTKQEYEQKIEQYKKESKLELALKDAKAKNPKAVKALLDDDKISVDGENLIGLDDQLKALQDSDDYLFESDEGKLKGKDPHVSDPNKHQQKVTKEQFNQMGYKDRVDLYQNDPDTYKQLTEK